MDSHIRETMKKRVHLLKRMPEADLNLVNSKTMEQRDDMIYLFGRTEVNSYKNRETLDQLIDENKEKNDLF